MFTKWIKSKTIPSLWLLWDSAQGREWVQSCFQSWGSVSLFKQHWCTPLSTKQEAAASLVKIFLVFRSTLRPALLQISTCQWTCCSMFSCTFLLACWGLIQSLLQIQGRFIYFFSGLWSTLWRQKYNCDRYMGEWTLHYHHISLWGDGKWHSAAQPCASQSSKSNMNPT